MAKKRNAKSEKLVPTAQSGSLRSTIIGTMFNLVATTATLGSVLLCLIVAKHFT
jgi:hypothetical protein